MLTLFRVLLVVISSFLIIDVSNAQTESYRFKKGEVLDIILVDRHCDSNYDSLYRIYRKTLFPIAEEYSYETVKGGGFKVKATLQGNAQYSAIVFGRWQSKDLQEAFRETIVKRVPEFHDMRRATWRYLALTSYEMLDDLAFSIDRSKYNVVTAYWANRESGCSEYMRQWREAVQLAGGRITVELTDGASPYQYHYAPDYLIITEWESGESFRAFSHEVSKISTSCMANTNEFKI